MQIPRLTHERDRLTLLLSRLAPQREDRSLVASAVAALDDKYDLARKIAREPGLEDILKQLTGRTVLAFGGLHAAKGKRVLDIACGSATSRAPSFIYVDTPLGERTIKIDSPAGYTAQFEPWLCRLLLEIGAQPVGVDIGDLTGETFEHYHADLGQAGALDFFPSQSVDAVHDSRLFGSPEFTERFPNRANRLRIAREIRAQEKRILKPEGIVIHSDAEGLVG